MIFFWEQNAGIATVVSLVRARPAACFPRLQGIGIDRCQGCVWRLLEPTTWAGPKQVKSVNCKERQSGTTLQKKSERKMIFFGHETLAHGATCYAMRFESREGDTSQGKKEQARRHPRWDQRVIRSLRDEESVDPNGEWSKNATRKDKGVSDHTFRTRANSRS